MIHKENTSRKFQKIEEMIEDVAQKMKLIQRIRKQKVEEKFLSPFGWEVQKKQDRKLLSQETSQISPHYKINTPKFDELPGEDKEHWHSEEIICIALGLEDLFQPKKNMEEGNSSGARVLECTSDFNITAREIKSGHKEDPDEPTESEPEFQMPNDLIASTKLDDLRLQPAPCLISKCQSVPFSKVSDKETLEANKYVIVGAQNPSDSGSVEKFTGEKLELFRVNHLDQCSLKTKLMLDTNVERKIDLIEGGDGFNHFVDVLKEGARETYIEKPIYDGDPRKGQECWLEQEFILAALGGKGNDNTKCETTPSHLEDGLNSGLCLCWPEFEDHQNVCKEACLSIMSKEDPTEYWEINQNKDAPCRDSPSAANSSDLGEKTSHLDKKNMFIFDPGGLVQEDHSTGVKMMLKDMIRVEELKLDEVAIINSACGQLGQWQIVNSTGLQGQDIQEYNGETDRIISKMNQHNVDSIGVGLKVIPYGYQYMVLGHGGPEGNRLKRPEYNKVSRKNVIIYIYDPGGEASCLHGVSAGILNNNIQ